jgi:exopolyphosphatase/guanosine-5'-triphosphate,3'-diphosphate pyrophosphatase
VIERIDENSEDGLPGKEITVPIASPKLNGASVSAKQFFDSRSDKQNRPNHPPKPQHNGHAAPGQPIYGALDLGTNNCRLLVARPSRRGFQVVDAFSRIIRLGEGVSQSRRLSDAAIERTLEALKVCSDKMHRRNVRRSRLIATEACRIAENGPEFVSRVQRETGLKLEVISRETEARLAVAGCASLLDRNCDWALVFDIGGGSTELSWVDVARLSSTKRHALGDRARLQAAITAWTSMPVGVVTLAERFGGQHVDRGIFEAMVEVVLEKLIAFQKSHDFVASVPLARAHLLGTSGTVTTIAGVHLKLATYSRGKVDGCWLACDEARTVSDGLLGLSYGERASQPCIGPDRADLVLAGCAILEAIMRVWPCNRLRVADRGLREGILTSLIAEDVRKKRNGWHD